MPDFLQQISEKLKQTEDNDFFGRLRSRLATPETIPINLGIPEPEFTSQIQELQKKGRGVEDANRAIDMHPQIVNKDGAKQFAGKLYEGFVQPFRNVLEKSKVDVAKSGYKPVGTDPERQKQAEQIVQGTKGVAESILGFLKEKFGDSQKAYDEVVFEPQRMLARKLGIDPSTITLVDPLATGEIKATEKSFKGFKDLTTKFLDYTKGKTTLSRQEIVDFARRPELKKGEADLYSKLLEDYEPVFHGTYEKDFKLTDKPVFLTKDFDEAATYAGGGYEWRGVKREGDIKRFLARPGKTLDLNKGENVKSIFKELYGSPELKKTFNSIPNEYQYISETYGDVKTLFPKTSASDFYDWLDIEFNTKPVTKKVGFIGGDKDIKIRTGSYSFDEKAKNIRQKFGLSFEVYGTPTRQSVYDRWGDVIKYAKKEGYDYIEHTTESPDKSILFPEKIALNPKKTLIEGDKLPAQEFADSIRRDLLELKPVKVKEPQYQMTTIHAKQGTKELRGNNYEEVVFESPITTNGSSHYPNSKNYFAHARGDEVVESGKKIWREQEIQSDALQKKNLQTTRDTLQTRIASLEQQKKTGDLNRFSQGDLEDLSQRLDELPKLESYARDDIFGERIMRERIKEKAQKGYEKYRLPTGETIGKIERFEQGVWEIHKPSGLGWDKATIDNLKIGSEVISDVQGDGSWIITDILGDGRFKAVPKQSGVDYSRIKNWSAPSLQSLKETHDLTGKSNPQYIRYEKWGKFLKNKYGGKEIIDPQGNKWVEIDLKKEMGKIPVEAFGKAGVGTMLAVGGAVAAAPFAKKAFDYIAENVKDEVGARKLTDELNKMIGPEGVVGAKNFDIHWNTIKAFIDKGEVENARMYAQGQSRKLKEQ